MRKDLLKYAESIVKDEWPNINAGGSDITNQLMQQLSNHLNLLSPKTAKQNILYTDIVRKTDQVIHARELRLLNASGGLPVFVTLNWLMSSLPISLRSKYTRLYAGKKKSLPTTLMS